MKGRRPRSAGAVVAATLATLLAGCQQQRTAASMAPPVVEVAAVVVQDVPIVKEWIGTLDGSVNAEIRAQVSGYVMRQAYKEGSFVRKGQLLFEIDPRPLQAALNQAQGNLGQAESNVQLMRANLAQSEARLGKADLDVKRYTPLAQTKAISQEEMDDAIQSPTGGAGRRSSRRGRPSRPAQAAVAAAKRRSTTAEVNLGFTKITAPIDGIAGIAMVQVGNLASAYQRSIDDGFGRRSDQGLLHGQRAGVHRLSPRPRRAVSRRWRLSWPTGRCIRIKGGCSSRTGRWMSAPARSGWPRCCPIRAIFCGRDSMRECGRVVSTQKGATLVPERAVSELQGSYQVAVVNSDNTVNIRNVRLGSRVGGLWVVEEGVQPGERVVVQGLQKIRNGATVNPKPYSQPVGAK